VLDSVANEGTHEALSMRLLELLAANNQLASANEKLLAERDERQRERDEYKQLYVALLEAYRKLELGLRGQKRERFVPGAEEQLTLAALLSMVVPGAQAPEKQAVIEVPAHARAKPTGRKALPEELPRVEVEVLPPDVQKEGLNAFERIGQDVSETVERRPSSVVVVRTVRGKYVRKGEKPEGAQTVLQGEPLEQPLPRALAGPGLLADSIVKKWTDHLPLHRMERIYGREGLPVARSTLCTWHEGVAALVAPLVLAMWSDALAHSAYLCTDATGVLVQALEKCRLAHFFVVVAPGRHVLFGYSKKHDGEAVDRLLAGFKGYLVADAHSVYLHLYETGDVIEVGCWSHLRRYACKALESDKPRATHALKLIQKLFDFEREWKTAPPEEKLRRRQKDSKPIVDAFFAWCDEESLKVLDETPISKAIGYARNHREAFCRFLSDGRLPLSNNVSERQLRREALGRKNWLFVATDEGGRVNATFVTLLASCEMHGLEPYAYLRDLLCLLPSWPINRVLELAPANWRATLERPEVQKQLDANVYRQVALGQLKPATEK
jgi:transposase